MKRIWDPRVRAVLEAAAVPAGTAPAFGRAADWFAWMARAAR